MSVHSGSRSGQIGRLVPGFAVLRGYKREWFRHDLVAGLVLTTLLVPQGMAYAGLAGLPPEVGLYTTAAALLAYALFGPSRILVVGPDSTLAPIVFATLVAVAGIGADPARAVALASALAILMGLICVAAGLAKLGIVAELLSKPVRIGFLNGVALIIIAGQLPKLVGLATRTGSVPENCGCSPRASQQAMPVSTQRSLVSLRSRSSSRVATGCHECPAWRSQLWAQSSQWVCSISSGEALLLSEQRRADSLASASRT